MAHTTEFRLCTAVSAWHQLLSVASGKVSLSIKQQAEFVFQSPETWSEAAGLKALIQFRWNFLSLDCLINALFSLHWQKIIQNRKLLY